MNPSNRRLVLFLLLWGAAAVVAGSLHLLVHLPAPAVPLLVAGLTIGFSVGLSRVSWLRDAAATVGVRAILAAHLIRFVGIYFLWLHTQGRLPVEFAQRAGWGDIAAAAGALILLFWPEGKGFGRAVFWWNIIGAADLLLAVGTGGWLNLTRPGSMIELAGLPLTLVPLWLVPVLLSSHINLFRQQLLVCSNAALEKGDVHPAASP
jgi:hypothetical protein